MSEHCGGPAPPGSEHAVSLAAPEPSPGGKGSRLGGCSRSPWLLKGSMVDSLMHLLRPPVWPSHVHIQPLGNWAVEWVPTPGGKRVLSLGRVCAWETPKQACRRHCPTQDPPQSSCPYFCRQVVCEAVHSVARGLLPNRLWGADQTIRPKVRVLLSPGGKPSLGPPKTGGWVV